MKKSELSIDHIQRINLAVEKGLGIQDWELVSLLNGGLTGIPVYRINVDGQSYAIKLENVADKNFDLIRNYQIIETVSKQGISPPVYLTDAQQGIILMQYIEPAIRLDASPFWINEFASMIRKLHDNNSFSQCNSVVEIFDDLYLQLPPEYVQKSIIEKSIQELNKIKKILFNPNDIRS